MIIATGYLQVQLFTAEQALPIKGGTIRVFKSEENEVVFEDYFMSDEEGKTAWIALYAPSKEMSLDEANRERPYETYNVIVRLDGYDSEERIGVQIFADENAELPIAMIPNNIEYDVYRIPNTRNVNMIEDHHLLTNYGGNNSGADHLAIAQGEVVPAVLNTVIIPSKITVHLGRPSAPAENVTVDFRYYLKNVASSEIYPTWPYEALKANIWAQCSLALNRVYTEWYRSRGYDFDITNNTAFDQAFVKNRNLYESVSNIVDEVFNEFIRKEGYLEPFYAEYCDGKIAQCPGMKQWGTLELANRGYDALRILKYYYGNDILIDSSDNIQDIRLSYPGTPLRFGDSGEDVRTMQEFLNAIAVNYPLITPIYPVNGVFNAETEAAVRVFQQQFNLHADGIIGKQTWYQISYIYVAVRKLAELKSLGRRESFLSGEYPGIVLRQGSRGVEVQQAQFYLASISLFYQQIPTVTIDSRFGAQMERAVLAFQRAFGLIPDGQIGRDTWNKLFEIYSTLEETQPGIIFPQYPGTPLQLGSSGLAVGQIQGALNIISQQYNNIPVLIEDSIFGAATQEAVMQFQHTFNLVPDGIVGETTWDAIFQTAAKLVLGDQPSVGIPTFPGTVLRLGSVGKDVELLQNRLNTISIYYKSIPRVIADGIFGNATRDAVIAFQQLVSITADGIVGEQTWNLIQKVYYELTT